MTATMVSCSLCGHAYDPATQAACDACPLHRACRMLCCPACGYTTVDTEHSRLAQWLTSHLARGRVARPARAAAGNQVLAEQRLALADAPVECRLCVLGFEDLPPTYHQHLQAYGLMPGQVIRVLQHRPVTVVQVDQLELALEAEIARRVWVDVAD